MSVQGTNSFDSDQDSVWRILAIDDDPLIHRTYAAILKSELEEELNQLSQLSGSVDAASAGGKALKYELDHAYSGEEGLQKVIEANQAKAPYAIVYMDMRMPPGWDGLETAEKIREVDPAVRIILITAYMDYELDEIRQRIGFDFIFMSKPIDANELSQSTALMGVQWDRAVSLMSERGVVSNFTQMDLSRFYPIKILLVDDSRTIRAIYGELLGRNGNYEVRTAASMDEALAVAKEFVPDLSIIDYEMPGGDGSQLTEKLLSQEETKRSLIVVFTVNKGIEEIALEAGAIDVFYKSDPAEIFLQRIQSIERYLRAQHELRTKLVTEAQARQQYSWLASIIEAVPDGLLVLDREQRIRQVNPAVLNMLGLEAERLIGEPLDEVIAQYRVESDDSRADFLLLNHDRERVPVTLTRVPLKTSETAMRGELVVLHNLTDFMQAESAQRTNLAKDEFIASMSHELRTPLSSIIGNSEMLIEYCSAEDNREYLIDALQAIESAGKNQLALVDDILDMSKIESGQFSVEESPYDLVALLESIGRMFEIRIRDAGLTYHLEQKNREPCLLIGDAQRISQILINLIGNAVKFTDSGSISLTTEVVDGELRFTVTDTGIGMPPEVVEQLFERFKQADGTISRRFGGSGLGLYISQNLARLMGGRIKVSSEEGKGSRFCLHLPYQQSDTACSSLSTEKQPQSLETVRFEGSVLIAEDTPELQLLERRILEAMGLTVTTCENGKEAVALAVVQPFDLILMDMQMPEMSGIEATRVIRQQGVETPVVPLTANVMQKHREAFAAVGCEEFLGKPIDKQELRKVLLKYLPQPE